MSKEPLVGIKDTLAKREEIVIIIFIAAILALGINLVASFLFSQFSEKSYVPFWVGTVLIVFALIYISSIVLRGRSASYKFESVIPIDRGKMQVTVIPGYRLTGDIRRALDAAFLENKALEQLWKTEPPVALISQKTFEQTLQQKEKHEESHRNDSEPSSTANEEQQVSEEKAQSNPASILKEVLEFVVLELLSTHLTDYFGQFNDRDKQTMTYSRNHVPDLLLRNRILSLLSTPVQDRAIFVNDDLYEPADATTYMIFRSDGAMYSRFELVLPIGTQVTRPAPGILKLENDRVVLMLNIDFDGYGAVLPSDFEKAYLGVDWDSNAIFKVDISLTTKVKISSLLRRRGWRYYQWIDSFADKLGEFSQFSRFLEKIDWEGTMAHFRIKENYDKLGSNQFSEGKQNESSGDLSDHQGE